MPKYPKPSEIVYKTCSKNISPIRRNEQYVTQVKKHVTIISTSLISANQCTFSQDQGLIGRNAVSIITSLSTKMWTTVRNNRKKYWNFSSQQWDHKTFFYLSEHWIKLTYWRQTAFQNCFQPYSFSINPSVVMKINNVLLTLLYVDIVLQNLTYVI